MILILQVENNKLLFSKFFRIFPDSSLKVRKVGWNVNVLIFFFSSCQLKSGLTKHDYKEFHFLKKRKLVNLLGFYERLWKTP